MCLEWGIDISVHDDAEIMRIYANILGGMQILLWHDGVPGTQERLEFNQSYILGKNNGHFMRASTKLFTLLHAMQSYPFGIVSHLYCLSASR